MASMICWAINSMKYGNYVPVLVKMISQRSEIRSKDEFDR